MEQKTKVRAGEGAQDIIITRDFDLPVESVFQAYTESELFEQWMGTKVIKLEGKKAGSWHFQTSNPQGIVVFEANGVFHDFVKNEKITRTFEMQNTSFSTQLEFLDFQKITEETSRLTIHSIYKTKEQRDQMLQLPFEQGLNMAHNKLQNLHFKNKTR